MENLANKVAVITGAGSGLGRALAVACAAESMKLVLADVDTNGMTDTVTQLQEKHPDIELITQPCDVSKREDVDRLANTAFATFSAVHLLFNNAGVAVTGPSWSTTPEEWDWVLGVNVMGVAHGVQAFVPRLLQQDSPAHIVNTASLAGLSSVPGSSIYCASKQAVVALSECLHHELAIERANIAVSVLCPAFFPTGIADSKRPGESGQSEENPQAQAYQQQLRKAVEAGRLTADDVAVITLDGVKSGQFYILPHRGGANSVAMRAEDILQGQQPRDPAAGLFSHRPE